MILWLQFFLHGVVVGSGTTCEGEACSSKSSSLLSLKSELHTVRVNSNVASMDASLPLDGMNTSNISGAETLIRGNLLHDFDERNQIPDPAGSGTNGTNATGDEGMASLSKNIEFVFLKVAQLETIVELQQAQIQMLKARLAAAENKTGLVQHDTPIEHTEAQHVFKKVWKKHHYQREKKQFVTPDHPSKEMPSKEDLESWQTDGTSSEAKTNDNPELKTIQTESHIDRVEMAMDVVRGFSDWGADCPNSDKPGINLDSNGVRVNWGRQKCRVSLMGQRVTIFDFNFGNTNVDWPEPIKTVASPNFPEWNAGCPEFDKPSLSVDSNGLSLNFGRQRCEVSLMGKTIKLIDFNFGSTNLQWPEPLKTVTEFGIQPIKTIVDLGREAVSCATSGGPLEVFKCFGLLIIQQVPPLSFLTRMGDMIQEFLEVFAVVAHTIVKKVLEKNTALLQDVSSSSFPKVGQPPVVHQVNQNLKFKKHAVRGPGAQKLKQMKRAKKADFSVLQRGDDDDDGEDLFEFEVHDNDGNYATKLITQFNGREIDTASCLAFAPKKRTGANGGVAQKDWQVSNEDDFIELQPWGVPCDNSWMKDHVNQWTGYSFYTWEMAIEKCITVSYSLSMQPVLAFVGGLEFGILPAPLADIETMVCYPDKQPGGVDLSVLRTVINSGGVMLFSRTMRLVKRFGSNTDFVTSNTYGAYETYRNPTGVAVGNHGVEDDRSLEVWFGPATGVCPASQTDAEDISKAMSRTSLVQNSSKTPVNKAEKPPEPELVWRDEELYLATMDYGTNMTQKILSEHRDHAAAERLGLLQTEASNGPTEVQLFRFRNPGLISFEIKGEMVDNQLDLVARMSLASFDSPEKRIPLVNLVDQFSIVLTALPFISADTKIKALASLRDFSQDVEKVTPLPETWDLSSTEEEADWGASFDHPGWSHTPDTAVITGFRRSGDNNLFNLEAAKIRDFQFAEHECRDILMNSFDHAHSWYTCPDGFFLSSLRRGGAADCNHLGCIDEAKCCRPWGAGRWGLCQVQDWWQSMSSEGSSTCPFPKAVAGLYRSDVSDLRGIGLAYCCELGVPTSTDTSYYLSETEETADWSSSFDHPGWSKAEHGFITGFYKSGGESASELYHLESAYFRKPNEAFTCKYGEWGGSLDHPGWSVCPEGYFVRALERSYHHALHNLEKAECCKPNSAPEQYGGCYNEHWGMKHEGAYRCKLPNTAMAGLERDDNNNLKGIIKAKCCQLPPASISTQQVSPR